jgi:hypothetical protein
MMFISRMFSLLLVAVVSFNLAQAQTSAEKSEEIEKQQLALFEQIAKDAEALRSPKTALWWRQNSPKAFGNTMKNAPALFLKRRFSELVVAQIQAEANKKQAGMLYGLVNGISPRQEILTMIAAHDAEFALDSFYKSRPAKFNGILTNPEEMKKPTSRQFVQSEISFEQTLIARVSEQNPQRAVKLARESLAKGVTHEVLALIEKIKIKDPELAAQFAGEVADKLLAADFDRMNQEFSLAASFVAQYGKKAEAEEKPLKVDEKKLRDLTSLLARLILKSDDQYSYEIENLLPIFEKFSPEISPPLNKKRRSWTTRANGANTRLTKNLWKAIPRRKKFCPKPTSFRIVPQPNVLHGGGKIAQSGNLAQAQKSSKQKCRRRKPKIT